MLELSDPQGLSLDHGLAQTSVRPAHLHNVRHLQQHFLQEDRFCGKAINGPEPAYRRLRMPSL
jgi:hypothetical protein